MLKLEDLTKHYGGFTALNGLNLELKKGELFGFVGPNGAGKTTTMRIITGLLAPDGGKVLIDGTDLYENPAVIKNKIGYMPDFFGVYDNLRTFEYMEFYASIYGIKGKKARRLINELLEMVNMRDQSDNYVDGLSRGMKQKLCLARCLIHDPELLILDEPASGLDPGARIEMTEILLQLNEMGKTIIISSHILPELAKMCTTLGIIQKGGMVIKGTVEEIMHHMNASNPLMIRVIGGQETAVSVVKANPFTENVAIKENLISLGFHGDEIQEAELLQVLIQKGVLVASFFRQEGNLESLFIELTKGEQEVQEE